MAMHSILRTRAAAIAACTVALTVAFASGAVAAGKITSADIKDHTIQAKDLKNGAVGNTQIKNGAVGTNKIENGAVGTKKIKDGDVGSDDIKNGSVGSSDLANGSVTSSKLAPGAVAFPNSLWGTVLRNQTGGAQSFLQAGPTGQPMGTGGALP